MFSVVILFHHLFPLLEKVEIRAFILPRNFPAVLIIFTGRGGAGNPPLPTARGGAGNPPFPAGRVPRGTGRPSLVMTIVLRAVLCCTIFEVLLTFIIIFLDLALNVYICEYCQTLLFAIGKCRTLFVMTGNQ